MKFISPDHAFVYYYLDRADGKLHGIRVGRSTGAIGFVAEKPATEPVHPFPFIHWDQQGARIPVLVDAMPQIMSDVIGPIEAVHPEAGKLLAGEIDFEQVVR